MWFGEILASAPERLAEASRHIATEVDTVQRRVLSILGFTMMPALISSVAVVANDNTRPATAVAVPAADAIARGKYLVTFGSCNDCHTPFALGPQGPEPD